MSNYTLLVIRYTLLKDYCWPHYRRRLLEPECVVLVSVIAEIRPGWMTSF